MRELILWAFKALTDRGFGAPTYQRPQEELEHWIEAFDLSPGGRGHRVQISGVVFREAIQRWMVDGQEWPTTWRVADLIVAQEEAQERLRPIAPLWYPPLGVTSSAEVWGRFAGWYRGLSVHVESGCLSAVHQIRELAPGLRALRYSREWPCPPQAYPAFSMEESDITYTIIKPCGVWCAIEETGLIGIPNTEWHPGILSQARTLYYRRGQSLIPNLWGK